MSFAEDLHSAMMLWELIEAQIAEDSRDFDTGTAAARFYFERITR